MKNSYILKIDDQVSIESDYYKMEDMVDSDSKIYIGGSNSPFSKNLSRDVSPCTAPIASFEGNSWVRLKYPNKIFGRVSRTDKLIISLSTKTRASNGLIFWQGNDQHYLALGVESNYLSFIIQFGSPSNRYELLSERPITDGVLRSIKISKLEGSLEMEIDKNGDVENITKTLRSSSLNLKRLPFFIGGSKNYLPEDIDSKFRNGFYGCINQFKIIKMTTAREMIADVKFNENEFVEEISALSCSNTCPMY
ncbi:unnamed protein product [Lepeophtheirus salmonis]|uniref:(salmon louse) hypothetical protein n=1 Tax=Lepeophtheirus salmonis TaxID=72036 RepID=A0A7R8HD04_LEPSM|nr:unnamed protein product [Lepeophtheirus salmonis]CAF3024902.1 unnamed protein product [Lepeophtheirus salmonis]